MFAVSDTKANSHCQGLSRRDFLRIGSLGLGGLTLTDLLRLRAESPKRSVLRDKAVVLLFLQGGPPHIEFFDPKMTAPKEFRSITGEVQTTLPGITFGKTFPKLAARAKKLSILRSYRSNNSGHTYLKVTSGDNEMRAAMSAIYSRVAGTTHPQTGMPRNVLLLPEAVSTDLKLKSNFETKAIPTLTSPGSLGASFNAFNPSGAGDLKQDMELRIPAKQFSDRKALLKQLDQLKRHIDVTGEIDAADRFQQQAFDVITGGVAQAFDLSKEDPKTIDRYDTSKLFKQEDLQKYHDMKRASNLLGRQMLLARRLCEAGCGFVTVSDCGWDYHANNNSPKNMTGIYPMGGQVDHAVNTFLDDLEERGLSEKILLVVTGEMGRSPRINKNGGRDHYGGLTSLLFAGGGLRMGQVIGRSDDKATKPATQPYDPSHLVSTVLNVLFDVGELRLRTDVPRAISKLAEKDPIRELF